MAKYMAHQGTESRDISFEVEHCKLWADENKAIDALKALMSRVPNSIVDWDEDAGENWISIGLNEAGVARIHTKLKLMFVNSGALPECLKLDEELTIIEYYQNTIENPAIFTMRPELLARFGRTKDPTDDVVDGLVSFCLDDFCTSTI